MTIAIPLESTGPPGPEIRRRVASARSLSLQQRDELLYRLLLQHRPDNPALLASLILDFMATSIKIRVSRYCPEGPTMTIHDVYQELVCALLEDALSIPLAGPAHLERRLLLRSADRVSRGLQREARHQQDVQSIEAWAEAHQNADE